MMINNINRVYGIYEKNSFKPTRKVSKPEEKRDSALISSKAKDYQQARSILSKTPDVREDRLSDISQKIESGNYQVTSEDIADKILGKYFG